MTTYRKIHGRSIQAVTTDPSESVAEGQVWYNTTSDTFKSVLNLEAWSSSSPTTQDQKYAVQVGTQTSALIFASGPSGQTYTEEYNGLGWTSGGSLGTGRYQSSGFGTQTAAVCAAGDKPPASPAFRGEVEEYDGTSWSEVNNVSTARYALTGLGILTAGAIIGGRESGSPAPYSNKTENYDGTNWTTGGTYPISVQNVATGGPQTSSFAVGGYTGSNSNVTANYDGSSWTASGNANTARTAGGGAGSQTDGLFFAGNDGSASNKTENYDGSSWTNNPATLGSARNSLGGSGTSTAALATGGFPAPPGTPKFTEEFNKSINTITAGAWASGGALNVPRQQTYGAGSQTAGLIFGGEGPPGARNQTEEYDGSTWTAVNNMPATNKDHAGFGIQTAAVACGGSPTTTSINYDGTNWTASPGSLNTGRTNAGGTGTQTAGLTFGGYPNITATEEYGGSTWTAGGALPTGRQNYFAAGTQTAALGAGGGPPTSTDTYEYDGSSWTSGGALVSGTIDARGGGTQTDALYAGGYLHPGSGTPTTTLGYNGTSWSTRPSLATATAGGGSGQNAAPANLNWIAGGFSPAPAINVTQEFTGETSVITAKTLTSS